VGVENLKPLDELKSLDQRVDLVTDLGGLKPIFYRLDEIAKQFPDDFEVQLVVGDIKQHLVNRGTRLKEQQSSIKPPPGAPPPLPAATPASAPTVVARMPPMTPPSMVRPPEAKPADVKPPDLRPPVKLMSSGQFAKPGEPAIPPAGPPPMPKSAPPPQAPLSPHSSTVRISPGAIPPGMPPSGAPPQTPPGQGLMNTGQQAPVFTPAARVDPPGSAVQPPSSVRTPAQPPKAPKPPKPPKPPSGWKRPVLIGGFLGALVAVGIIAFLVNQARKKNQQVVVANTVKVDVTTTPPNASIRINGDAKCSSPCKIELAPGTYQVTAFLDGYDPATNSINVAEGQPASVALTLAAMLPSVRILTDLDQGKIAFDDQPPADLQEGQFILDKVAVGQHKVKLTGKSGDASFSFEIVEAKPPAVTGTVTARNLVAVLVSSFGSQARVVTSSGPMKLAVNGQPEGDAGPGGVDLKSFQPGVDEIIVGEGKDQRNMKESFGPAPMLTAFLKSDLNIGTLIVSTGEDDVRVFVNNKENRGRTQRGQVRIPAIGPVTVRVAKDGFQSEPAQTADVRKGAEVRLEFKLRTAPQTSSLQIHGATPGAEVFLDQNSVGTVGADGNYARSNVSPGDHVIDLKHDQFTPKRLQRNFKAGQAVVLTGADVVLAAVPVTSGTVHVARTPADAAVTYHRADETQTHEVRGNLLELPAGSYVFTGKAPGYTDKTERIQLAAGENHNVELALAKVVVTPTVKTGDMGDFEDPAAWKKEGDLWTHKGGGFVPYKLGPKGVYTFTVELVHGGNLFKGGRVRWCVQYVDAKNYLLYEMDKKNFWAEVVANGKKLEREKYQHDLEKQKSFTVQIELAADHVVHRIKNASGQWVSVDSFAEPGRNFAGGKFGFLIQGNDELGVSDFSFTPAK
jgi:hypothetical protein